jgi:hypothetical protein
MSAPIRVIHYSLRRKIAKGRSVLPRDMERIQVPIELSDGLAEIALSIFADCVNVGATLQDAILAVYLSGLQHGNTISKERAK